MAETMQLSLLYQSAEEEEEKKYIEENERELISESGSEAKEQQTFEKIHEIDLERKFKWRTWDWKPCKVRIIRYKHSASIRIDNDDYFMEYSRRNSRSLPLHKCTISFSRDTADNNQTIILYLELLYQDNNSTFITKFRLPQHKQEEVREEDKKEDAIKLTLFAATLRFYGSGFDKLKTALKRWEEQGFTNKKLSKSQVIEIFRTKYQYDLFESRHAMNRYIQMIENMDDKVIKPLHGVLKLTEFSNKDPKMWRERCKKALQIDYEWKILSSQIKVQLDKICQISTRTPSINLINYKTIAHCDEIQSILQKLSEQAKNFYNDFIAPELAEWRGILLKYKECSDDGMGKQWKIIVGIFLALAGAAVVVGILFFPPAGAAATTGTAGASTATVISTAGWLCVGAGITGGVVGVGLVGFGLMQYFGLSKDYGFFKDVEEVLRLWEKFQKIYLNVCGKINTLKNQDISGGPRGLWNDYMRRLVRNNMMEMRKMSGECVKKIKKIS